MEGQQNFVASSWTLALQLFLLLLPLTESVTVVPWKPCTGEIPHITMLVCSLVNSIFNAVAE